MNRRTFLKMVGLLGGSLWPLRSTWGRLLVDRPTASVRMMTRPMELLLAVAPEIREAPSTTLMSSTADPKGECPTRAPIPYEANPYNQLLEMFTPGKEQEFEDFLRSLRENRPEVMFGPGGQFVGLVPFDTGIGGVIAGVSNPVLGDSTQQNAPVCTGYERLLPAQAQERIDKLTQYTQALHSQGKVKRVMPYIDFGTQLFGRHLRSQTTGAGCCTDRLPAATPSAWGFWEFYDKWDQYASPAGPFDLGPKPPSPTTWLRRWHDPEGKYWPDLPDELKGLSFQGYRPDKCDKYGPHYRYAVCINTEGWASWWKQVVQWAARVGYDGVFVDNATFTGCWNEECQEGYRGWLHQRYTDQEIQRYFTTTANDPAAKNLLPDPSFERWFQQAGQWQTPYWGSYPSPILPIYPDIEAYRGRYSCRIESRTDGATAAAGFITVPVPANQPLRLTFYYKTAGSPEVTMIISKAVEQAITQRLAPAKGWTQATVDFLSMPSAAATVEFNLRFAVSGAGTVWLDEFWLGEAAHPPVYHVELEPDIAPDPVRQAAAIAYWAHVADEKLGYLRTEARKVNPRFEIFTNGFHAINVDSFMTERVLVPELDTYRQKQRKDVGFYPGIYSDPQWEEVPNCSPYVRPPAVLVSNVFGYKYIHALRRPDSFGYHMPYLEGPPPAPEHPDKALHHNVDSVLLNLAEAAAFGDGAGCDPAYHRFYDGIYDTHGLTAQLRAVEKQFWQFIRANRCLYHGYHTHADIGIVFHDVRSGGSCTGQEYVELTDLAKDLAGHSVLWDVLTENRCDTASFARVRALVYQDVSRLSEAEREAVQVYLEQGGLVIAAKIVGDEDEWFRMRLPDAQRAWPPVGGLPQGQGGARERPAPFRQQVGAGLLIYQPGPLDAEAVLAAVEAHIGRTAQCAGNVPREVQERLRLNAWMRPGDGGSLVLHVVNYNVPLGTDQGGQVQPLEQVQVRVPLPSGTHVQEIMLYSPETDLFSHSEVEFDVIGDSLISFTIPRMRIYTVAEIALSPIASSLQ